MKSFKQFHEELVSSNRLVENPLKSFGKVKLLDIVKTGAAAYGVKKVADYLGRKSGESEIKKPQPKPKYQNPSDGSIPGRYKDESLKDYYQRRNQGYKDQINKI